MRAGQLAQRMMSAASEVIASRIRAGLLTEDEWIALHKAVSTLSGLDVFIDDDPHRPTRTSDRRRCG